MSKILFPELPTPAEILSSMASYFSSSKKEKPLYVVFDKDGQPRHWSVKRSASESWGHAHLWDAFKVERFTGAI